MVTDIKKQIDNINNGLQWIKKYHPEHYDTRFLQLVECRKVLKNILAAEENNPGIAAFGKSQVGKSYLIGCLLQNNGKPFKVKDGEREHDFVRSVNPPSSEGGGRESTGVVSRFSSFKRDPYAYSADFPVLVKAFSLTDIIIVLADDYYNDFKDYEPASPTVIENLCSQLQEMYAAKPAIPTPVISADDILYMKGYFIKHINNAQACNDESIAFFDRLALVIENVQPTEYLSIFSEIWSKDENINRLYNKLYDILRQFGFARYIYLPMESVLHNGVRENTIMSVQCLKELLGNDINYFTDAYTKENGQMIKRAANIPKSHICAICSEVVFKIEDSFLSSTGKYELDSISDDVKSHLNHNQIQMSMLRDNDLLDFPGARSREKEEVSKLKKDSVLLNCFLRGKVAYLFNKYNDEMGINILLYCHHNKDNDVAELYQLLQEWVNNYVGASPEDRQKKLAITKISPLFYIGTMFNLDMALVDGVVETEASIDQRWVGRFDTVINKQCFHSETVGWVHNWTQKNENFQNSYVLRDYKFSGAKYNMYEGFFETQRETGMIMSADYYKLMRKTFIQNKYVKQLFFDPALSWEVAASMNNDGALYIIENLAIVAERMDEARNIDFAGLYSKSVECANEVMKKYLISDDTADLLTDNIRKANCIFRELEFTCQLQPEYFGHLLQALQMTEAESFKELHRLIPTLAATVNDTSTIKDYELIRKRCDNFAGCDTELEKWMRFIERYRFSNQDEAVEYLKQRSIEPKKLFQGDTLRRKNSAVIANHLVTTWEKKISSVQFANSFTGKDQIDKIVMTDLITCIISNAKNLQLIQRIESEIAEYVDVLNTSNINEDLTADMIATTISDYVIDFGYRYLTAEQIETSRRISREQCLPCFECTKKERKEHFDEDEMTQLFNEILSSTNRYTPAYEANYNSWLEYLYIAFIVHVNAPEYNREANDELKLILEELS